MVKRIGAALLWPLALAFLFIGFNKNDPYLISLRGVGNVVTAKLTHRHPRMRSTTERGLDIEHPFELRSSRNRTGVHGTCAR